MTNYRRGGKRAYRSGSASGNSMAARTVCRILFFPLLFVYLELVLHLYMKMNMKYFVVYFVFALAAGCLFSAVTMPFKRKVNRVLSKVFAVLITLVYIIELIAKKILQSYYPFSTLGLAAENHLTDYMGAIVSMVVRSIPVIIVMFLPVIFLFVLGNRLLLFPRTDVRFAGVVAVIMVLFHLLGLGLIHLPWNGDLTPAQLYKLDTNLDDQVEQLGLVTMLRLDLKHMIVPAGKDLDDDFGTPSQQPSETPSADVEPSDDPEVSPTPVIDTSPNVMDVDLEAVAESTSNEDIQWLAKYFNSKTPTNKNQYTGMFEGYNVIFLTLEGFSGYAIDPELTPTLYKLANEGFVFKNFYTALHYTSTSGGECQNLLGLYPKDGNPSSMKRTGVLGTNCYFSLAQQLGRLGYTNLGYHGNTDMYGRYASHTNLGYTWKQYQTGLQLEMNSDGSNYLWPQRDKYVIDASVDDYINSDTPFNIYYLTISGHMPYSNNRVANQYRDLVDGLPYSDTTKNYVATVIEVDRALEELLTKLEEAGKLDNTLIVASPDHVPYFNVDTLEELSGETFGSSEDLENLKESSINVDVYKNTLFIWSASMEEPVYVDKVCCQVDILPTVSNLLGLEYDSRMLSGSDILSDSEGQVIFHSRSWLTDKGYYNRYTQEFTPAAGVTMTAEEQESYVDSMKKQVTNKLSCTELIIENDFYDYVFNKFQG
jgi:lipoteichoic acid synthase